MRKKSYKDIRSQARRLVNKLYENPTEENVARANKVFNASGRYLTNLIKSKTGQRTYASMRQTNNAEERERLDRKFVERKFSQRTYMGLTQG